MAASVRDVAERAGVSVGTVSNVLNRPAMVAPATVERVRAAIAELGFVRNDAARQLRAGSSTSVGLIVLDVRNPFFTEVARGAESRAAADNVTVLLGNSDERQDRERRYLEQFEQQRVRGILVSPLEADLPRLTKLRQSGIPVVLVDRAAGEGGFSSVSVDDLAGGRLAAEHLIAIGRQRLAFVGAPRTIQQAAERWAGAQEVAGAAGVGLDLYETDGLSLSQGRAAGERIIACSPTARPDAVFAANDLLAIGLLQALMAAGLRVPADIALIGYDDIDFASAAVVPLSSIRQPAHDIGHAAMNLLLAEADVKPGERRDVRNVIFTPELVVRASTAGRNP